MQSYMIFGFRLDYLKDNILNGLATELESDLNNNREELVINSKTRGVVSSYIFRKKLSKQIIVK